MEEKTLIHMKNGETAIVKDILAATVRHGGWKRWAYAGARRSPR